MMVASASAQADQPVSATAQDSARQQAMCPKDVVITAEGRESTVREVPVSIATFGGELLCEAQVYSVSPLMKKMPGITAKKSLSIVAIPGNVFTFRAATLDTPVAYFLSASVSTTNFFFYISLPGSAVNATVRSNPLVTNITCVQEGNVRGLAVFGEAKFEVTDKLAVESVVRPVEDLRLTANDCLQIGLWGKNLTNNYRIVNADDITTFLAVPGNRMTYWTLFANRSRTYGLTLPIRRLSIRGGEAQSFPLLH